MTHTEATPVAAVHDDVPWMSWCIGGCLGAAVGGILGFGTFVLIAGGLAGRVAAKGLSRGGRHPSRLIRLVALANTVSWIVPVLGVATASATLAFEGAAQGRRNAVLAWSCMCLSLAGAMYGVVRNHMI